MSYIGNNLQVAYPSYLIIDDISSQFNGVLKTFALRVAGSTPVPFPINPQQCLISVNNIVQKPDSTGVSGFTLTGSNIVFATAPTAGWSFFGTILAGADYVNVGANFPSGTAAIPSITFDQSTGTGLFLASSNVLGITTGGVQRLAVNSSGFVGIGTTSPGVILDVNDPGSGLRFQNSASGNFNIGLLGGTSSTDAYIYQRANAPLVFGTNNTERLRITSAGLVGIGTNSPGNKLAVIGSTGVLADSSIRVNGTAGTSSANSGLWLSGNQSTSHYNWLVGSQYNINGALEITPSTAIDGSTFSTPTAVFTQTGRVGIGTSSPSSKLEISSSSGSGSSYSAIKLNNTSFGGARIDFGNSSVADLGSLGLITEDVGSGIFNDGVLVFNTSEDGTSNERMRISSRGLVGIGATNPLTKLEVRSGVITAGSVDAPNGAEILRGYYGSNGALVVIGSEYSSGGAVIGYAVKPSTTTTDAFLSSASGALSRGAYTIAGNIHKWYIGGSQTVAENSSVTMSEAMRIDASGRVGIGTTSPLKELQINATTPTIRLEENGGGSKRLEISIDSSGLARIDATQSSSQLLFGTVANERARIDSSGRLLVGTSSQPNTGGTLCVNNGIGIVNNTTNRFATVEHGNGASGTFTTITISAIVQNTASSVIFETLMTGYSGVYLDNVSGQYSNQAAVTMRSNASAGTSAALTVNGAGTTYTLTITTSVTHPAVKVKVTAGGLAGDITLPTITFA